MRRWCALLVPAVLLAGCAGGGGPVTQPVDSIKAGFPPGGLADVIRIDTVYRLPLGSAELVGPDGATTPAGSVEIADSPRFATGQYVANDPWKTGISGSIGPGTETLDPGPAGAALRGQVQILTTVSTASIPLPDPVAYRRDWQHYRIHLAFGLPLGTIETRDIEAPEPPPPPPPAP